MKNEDKYKEKIFTVLKKKWNFPYKDEAIWNRIYHKKQSSEGSDRTFLEAGELTVKKLNILRIKGKTKYYKNKMKIN